MQLPQHLETEQDEHPGGGPNLLARRIDERKERLSAIEAQTRTNQMIAKKRGTHPIPERKWLPVAISRCRGPVSGGRSPQSRRLISGHLSLLHRERASDVLEPELRSR